ncbi:MAG: hypothetical protein IPK10_05465 [Bacteroidetes bacterium]|nr:hypothetical protein [Bacteroidota bacterium]
MTCEDCITNVGTEGNFLDKAEQDYNDNGGTGTWNQDLPEYQIALELHKELLKKCDEFCGDILKSACDKFIDQMKTDVSPGGQYFLFDDDVVNNIQSCPSTPLPLFSVLCSNSSGIDAPYKTLVYKDELNNYISIETDGGIMKKPNELSLSEFVLYFQAEWANTLVQLHPRILFSWLL